LGQHPGGEIKKLYKEDENEKDESFEFSII
jgi:hypothetical protein